MGCPSSPSLSIVIGALSSTVVHAASYDILYQIELDVLVAALPVDMP
jgi:hypothetical protein